MSKLFTDGQILDLVEHIYAAGCDPTEWPKFVAKVQAKMPGSHVHALFDIAGTQIAYNSASVGISEEYIASYLTDYYRINPYNKLFSGLPLGRIYTSGELGSPGWLDRDPFFNEWLLPAGRFTHGSGVVLAREEGRQLRVTVDLPTELAHAESESARFLQRITPHLMRAFAVNEKLAAAVASTNALGSMLERMEGAAAVLDVRGRVISMNAAAQALARAGSLLRYGRDGRLIFVQPAYDGLYQRALAAAVDAAASAAPHGFNVKDTSVTDAAVIVLPLRPPPGNIALAAAQPRALLVIRRDDSRNVPPKQLLQTLYGLTPAEAEVAMHLVRGATPQEAADNLGISRTTARNQIAAAMTKLGVHRQAELVAAVSRLAPVFKLGG